MAHLEFLVERTEREGKPLISRQARETTRGENKKFSISYYRRLNVQEAIEALRGINLQRDIEKQLSDAMRASVPVWHVVTKGVDWPRKNVAVSTYFMQNTDELRDFVQQCLIESLDQDDPGILQEAVAKPQFRDWCHQWYQQSEDLLDARSVRYVCRLAGCAVLTRCVRNDFGDCTRFLLNNHSDITSSEEPHLVLAEPMRYFGKFEVNAFLEAAYNGAPAALEALIQYGNAHQLPWREARDSDGQTALDIARKQIEKGRSGAESCFVLLQPEFSAVTDMPRGPRGETLAENVLVVSWIDEDEQELKRIRQPLPLEASWKDLVNASRAALLNPPDVPGHTTIIIYKSVITDGARSDVMEFFELWSEAKSIGLSKSKIQHPDAPLHMCEAVAALINRPDTPAWTRLYVFTSFVGIDLTEDAASRLAAAVEGLGETLASRLDLPLWRLDSFPARLLPPHKRYLSNLLKAAMDVKTCMHQLNEGKELHRFFWPRLEAIERHMLDRMRLLSDTAPLNLTDAIDPQAVTYIESCVRLWVLSLQSDQAKQVRLNIVLGQIDNALSAALLMHTSLPGLAKAIGQALPEDMLTLLPDTAARLSDLGGWKNAAAEKGYADNPDNAQSRVPVLSVSLTSQSLQFRPAWAGPSPSHTGAGICRMSKSKQEGPADTIQPEDSVSNASGCCMQEARNPRPIEPAPSCISQSSQISRVSGSLISAPDPDSTTHARCFLAEALFQTPGNVYLQAQHMTVGSIVCAASGGQLLVKSIEVHRQQDQELVALTSATASLKVTSSHRVVVQRRGHGSQTVPAMRLKPGDPVLCTGSRVEDLVEVQTWTEKADVVQVVFQPDEPVEAFFAFPSILSKGHASAKTRRSMRGQHEGIEQASIPDTEYADGW